MRHTDGIDELIPTRKSLLVRLKDWSDNASWKDFFETYWRLIYRRAKRAGLTDSESQDVVQETMVAVFKAMPRFEYREDHGSFKSWLFRLTNWRIVDQLRKRDPEFEPTATGANPVLSQAELEALADPHSLNPAELWESEWQSNLMEVAVERVKVKSNPKQYQVFAQCVFKNRPVAEVARAFGITAARVYLAKHRISGLLKREIKALQKSPVPPVNPSTKLPVEP